MSNCPDRNNDAVIIAEIQRRKKLSQSAKKKEVIEWEGNFQDLQLYADTSRILSATVEKTGSFSFKAELTFG